jgi:hypothetical protein
VSPVQPAKTRQGAPQGTQSASSDPLSLRSLKVGDEVMIEMSPATVTRATVQSIQDRWLVADGRRFALGSGWSKINNGPSWEVFTPAGYEREVKLRAVRKALADLVYHQYRVSKSRLLAIQDTLKAAGLL